MKTAANSIATKHRAAVRKLIEELFEIRPKVIITFVKPQRLTALRDKEPLQ